MSIRKAKIPPNSISNLFSRSQAPTVSTNASAVALPSSPARRVKDSNTMRRNEAASKSPKPPVFSPNETCSHGNGPDCQSCAALANAAPKVSKKMRRQQALALAVARLSACRQQPKETDMDEPSRRATKRRNHKPKVQSRGPAVLGEGERLDPSLSKRIRDVDDPSAPSAAPTATKQAAKRACKLRVSKLTDAQQNWLTARKRFWRQLRAEPQPDAEMDPGTSGSSTFGHVLRQARQTPSRPPGTTDPLTSACVKTSRNGSHSEHNRQEHSTEPLSPAVDLVTRSRTQSESNPAEQPTHLWHHFISISSSEDDEDEEENGDSTAETCVDLTNHHSPKKPQVSENPCQLGTLRASEQKTTRQQTDLEHDIEDDRVDAAGNPNSSAHLTTGERSTQTVRASAMTMSIDDSFDGDDLLDMSLSLSQTASSPRAADSVAASSRLKSTQSPAGLTGSTETVEGSLTSLKLNGLGWLLMFLEASSLDGDAFNFETSSDERSVPHNCKSGSGCPISLTLGTIHAAKGLEWDYVVVLGVENEILPHYHIDEVPDEEDFEAMRLDADSDSSDEEFSRTHDDVPRIRGPDTPHVAEERRLLYVHQSIALFCFR